MLTFERTEAEDKYGSWYVTYTLKEYTFRLVASRAGVTLIGNLNIKQQEDLKQFTVLLEECLKQHEHLKSDPNNIPR